MLDDNLSRRISTDYIMFSPHTASNTAVSWPQEEGQLAIDVLETPTTLIVRSAIAGVAEQDLEVQVNDDLVTIRGERRMDPLPAEATIHYEECFWGPFSRSIILPCRVHADEAQATMKNGVLTITIPKAKETGRLKVRHE